MRDVGIMLFMAGVREYPVLSVFKVSRVLELYREKYSDFNVKHFHEKLVEEHGIKLSYTWTKTALQTAGLVPKRRKRDKHCKKRLRNLLVGMMLHLDGSRHSWLSCRGGELQDFIVIMDDATSQIYDMFLVKEEDTRSIQMDCFVICKIGALQ